MTQQRRSPVNHPPQDDIGPGLPSQRDHRGEGPAKPGLGSDDQRDLVTPSGVNQRDHGSADDSAAGDGELSFEDDEVMSGRGNGARTGGTWSAEGGDSGKLGPPREILSDRNGPGDPDHGPGRKRS
jgi:hypothetical protein